MPPGIFMLAQSREWTRRKGKHGTKRSHAPPASEQAGRGSSQDGLSVDGDGSGEDAAQSLSDKLTRFGYERDVVVQFHRLGLNLLQVRQWGLPTRPHKRKSPADRKWPHPFACELDAIPPDQFRDIVREAIEQHLPPEQLAHLRRVEQLERETMLRFVSRADG